MYTFRVLRAWAHSVGGRVSLVDDGRMSSKGTIYRPPTHRMYADIDHMCTRLHGILLTF